MAKITNTYSSFPDQVVPDDVKQSQEYGQQVGMAIEGDWFSGTRSGVENRFNTNYNNFRMRRLYARAEQPVQKYKDELAINGDLSYLNLDWKPVPIIPKFVDIVVNGMDDKLYDIKAFAQDPESRRTRSKYAEDILRDMQTKEFLAEVQSVLGMNLFNTDKPEELPESKEELDLHMQLTYKQASEIACEEAINNTLEFNRYNLKKKRVIEDLVILGIGALKTTWNKAEGVKIDYVDPARLVYSYSDDPNFEDLWYVGEVKALSLADCKKQFPNLTNEELTRLQQYQGNGNMLYNRNGKTDGNYVYILYFEYKTYSDQVFKIKKTATGLEKALEKPDTFDPQQNDNFDRVSRSIEVLYTGAKVLGYDMLLDWKLAENMTRPKSNLVKVNMNYSICCPKMYGGRIESLVSRMQGFADMIQLTHLKIQQVISKVIPDGVYLDVDGLAEVDLGNGTNYNAKEALNMYFQTGSILGRSMNTEGDPNGGRIPIQELVKNDGGQKIASLISTYQYYLQMIRDVTGLNEARDGTMPNSDMLVGMQKLAAASSNTATKHILNSYLYLTVRTCENIVLRTSDSIEFDLTKEALKNSISTWNVGQLEDLSTIHLCDFGIYFDLVPDEKEKEQLEANIQAALQSGSINLEDAIDIRQIRNLKLANQMIKLKRKKAAEAAQAANLANIQAQGQANAQASEASAMAEVQKSEAQLNTKLKFEKGKSGYEIERMRTEAQIKRELMELEFNYNMQLGQQKINTESDREQEIENRKDERTKIVGTQQSAIADQKQNNLLPINFENNQDLNI
jgi:hypothetical protein|tara:strand:+ start:437 stop:2818 length:2382 start_codon:yes stop_codon:yes gene_type:complete